MFAGASKRSLQHDAHKQAVSSLESLHLPFLCPALFAPPTHFRRISTISQVRSSRSLERSRSRPVKQTAPSYCRNLASAAAVDYAHQQDDPIPWGGPSSARLNSQSFFSAQSITALRAFDSGVSPLIINDTLSTHPKKFRAADAVSGDLNEIHQTLHACLQVGRLERAAAQIRRLNQIYKPDAPGLLAAHNEYLSEIAHRIVRSKDQQLLQHLQRWFQVDLRDVGVEPNGTTYAMMIRASLQTSDAKKDRTVRRFVNLAVEAGVDEETEALLSLYEDAVVAPYFRPHGATKLPGTVEADRARPNPPILQPTKKVDEVRAMEQKGSGLLTLKKSLSIFSESPVLPVTGNNDKSPDARQRLLELNTVNAAIDRWHAEDAHLKSIGVNSGLSTSEIGSMMWKWHESLVPLIKSDISKSKEAENKEKKSKSDEDSLLWGPYLQSLSPEKISAITILSVMKNVSTESRNERGVRLHNIVQGISDAVQNESIAEAIRNNRKDKNWRGLTSMVNARSRHDSLAKLVRSSTSRAFNNLEWGQIARVQLGALLLSHLMDVAKVRVFREDPKTGEQVQEMQPVVFHTFQYLAGKRVGVVRLNSVMMEMLAKVPVLSVLTKYLPMLCEPKPWVGYREGGFLEYPVPVVRANSGDEQSKRYAITAAENGDMAQVFAGLDVLAKTPWNINRFVFDTMLEAWNSGKAIAKIPSESPSTTLPPEPPATDDIQQRFKWMKRMREFENHRSGLKSQRCFQNFQLEVARAYLNETFYFPHNCDFRGRAYPLAPFLNHMGPDNVRGMLIFAQGKELTSDGLWWLKVHLANVYGYDKASFRERIEFTEAHLSDIRDSANNPLNGRRWWLEAEDPWQCLAACKEVKNALDLPDPTKYVCHLAIHQDGTCNGLQHYAALGGDVAGAQQVNLEPGQRPSDIYTAVAELVKAEIAKDAAQGGVLAQALEGKVTRKIVKQTVMTNVYGVTFEGAKRQVRKQLDELLPDFPDTARVNRVFAAPYIVRKIFAALATMFNGAHDIQYWLTACAARISESLSPEQVSYIINSAKGQNPASLYKKQYLKGSPKNELTQFKSTVIWTTPLRMPVVQPYRKKTARRIETNLQNITITVRSSADPVDKAKQLQAFPPNFIHSLDATHMFLTALKCNELGLTFAAIHDSFWTHAGDVNTMNRVIRDAFIRMHSEDIVGRLASEFKTRYKDFMHLARLRTNTPLAQKITSWRKKRRDKPKGLEARKWDELLLERRRLDLLASEDPKEREEGEHMITPGQIFAHGADEKTLAPMDAKSAILGKIPDTRSAKLKANQQLDVGDVKNVEPLGPATVDEAAAIGESDPQIFEAEPLASADNIQDGEDDEQTDGEVELGSAIGEKVQQQPEEESKRRETKRYIDVWLPLTFPPVPKKGDFDVTRLKDSQYFFS